MSERLPRLPYVLLILMTLATFGGPVAIGAVLRGGRSPDWPPDRPVEWCAFAAICGLVVALMIACLAVGLVNQRALKRRRAAAAQGEAAR